MIEICTFVFEALNTVNCLVDSKNNECIFLPQNNKVIYFILSDFKSQSNITLIYIIFKKLFSGINQKHQIICT